MRTLVIFRNMGVLLFTSLYVDYPPLIHTTPAEARSLERFSILSSRNLPSPCLRLFQFESASYLLLNNLSHLTQHSPRFPAIPSDPSTSHIYPGLPVPSYIWCLNHSSHLANSFFLISTSRLCFFPLFTLSLVSLPQRFQNNYPHDNTPLSCHTHSRVLRIMDFLTSIASIILPVHCSNQPPLGW